MANVVATNVYQINSNQTFPAAQSPVIGFPTQGCLLRGVTNEENGTPGDLILANGVRAYGKIQLVATGDQYYVKQTLAQLVTLFNA